MPRNIDLAPKKLPKQRRAIITVEALVEAATYILEREGLSGFTANKVAEKAGVNIASFYQYFPNKEALIFHIVRQIWEQQTARLSPILTRPGTDHSAKLRDFIRAFFTIEAEEVGLRRALRVAAVDLRETDEFKALLSTGAEMMRRFIIDTTGGRPSIDLEFAVPSIVTLTTSFAERTTDEGTIGDNLIRQADLLADMLIAHFRII